jgi:hypothetical protein
MKFNLTTNLVLKWICPILVFPECLQLIIVTTLCVVAINVFAPHAFNPKSQYFLPLFNKISWLWRQLGKDETSNEGCKSSPTLHDFWNDPNVWNALVKIWQLLDAICIIYKGYVIIQIKKEH